MDCLAKIHSLPLSKALRINPTLDADELINFEIDCPYLIHEDSQ